MKTAAPSDEAPPAPPECCLYCRFYFRRNTDPVAAKRALDRLGHVVPEGNCHRYPAPVLRSLADWCGEFRPRPGEAT